MCRHGKYSSGEYWGKEAPHCIGERTGFWRRYPLAIFFSLLIDNQTLHLFLKERILSEVSYSAPELAEEAKRQGHEKCNVLIDDKQVHDILEPLLKKQDLSRYII
jgi:hypothetical protein